MIFKIKFSDEALADLSEARDYYIGISSEILKKFDNVFANAVERLELHPENFQKRYRDVKIIFTKTFPYGIHYLLENQTVYIQRVLHQKQYYK